MKITRRGETADFGGYTIEFATPKFDWCKVTSNITVKQRNVRDFSSKSHHSYTISVDFPELNSLLATLAVAATENPVEFEKELEPSLKALLRIQAVVAGMKT